MTTPDNVINITTGNIENIENAAVAVGPDAIAVNNSPGAKIYKVASNAVATRRKGPLRLLPSKPENFIGRQADVETLRTALQSSHKVSLWGDNGIGKSTLVSSVMYSLDDGSRSIAYLDAGSLGLHGEDLLLGLWDLFYQRPLGDENVRFKPASTQMLPDLQDADALVFVDSPDLSGNDVASLINAAPKCSFVFIATRRALLDGKALRLQGLPDSDGIRLFSAPYEEQQQPLDDAARQAGIQICELLKGIPDLIIRLAIRGAGNDETPAQLLAELKAAGVDDLSLANLTTATLSPNEKKVLMFLAVAGDDITVPAKLLDALQNRFPDLDVVAILDRLKSLHLAQSHSPRYSLCGSLPSVLAGAWDFTAARDQMLAVALDWLPAQEPSASVEDSLPLMQRLLSDAAARLKWPDVIRLGRALEPLVFRYTRWQAWADVLDVLLRAAQATADAALEGWVLHQLGSRALAEGTRDVASTYLSQALKIRESIKDVPGLEVTRHNLDVLKAATTAAHGHGSGKNGSGGGRYLTLGLFGFAGLVVLAVAGYALLRPKPASPAPPAPGVPPIAFTTTAPPPSTDVPTGTVTAAPTSTLIPTDIPTAPPTDIPLTAAPFGATVTGVDFLACRYGPGSAYMFYGLVGLKNGAPVQVLGRADTALGQWALVQYALASKSSTKILPCWVSVNYLNMTGDISSLPELDPHYVFPLFTDPKYVPGVFPYPTITDASRSGDQLQVSVEGKDLVYIDENHADRESGTSPLFLVEFWVCQNGKLRLDPQRIYFAYDPAQPTASGAALATDDGSCGQQPYGAVYLAHRDGYIGPVQFQIPP